MDKFNCILYGEGGVGKTPMCGTLEAFEKTSPCLFLDVDRGTMSLDSTLPEPTVVPISTLEHLQTIRKYVSTGDWKKLAGQLTTYKGSTVDVQEYKSIVIDSGTELERNLREKVVAASDKNEGVASQDHYQKVQRRFAAEYRKFRDLSVSVIVIAGLRELKEESTGIIKRYPEFQPSLCRDLVRMTDLVLYLSSVTDGIGANMTWKHVLLTAGSQRFIARDRSMKLKPSIDGQKFTWAEILKDVLV